MTDLPILSIRQPWAWAILHAGKDIENRDWPTRLRGRILIHAAMGCTRDEYDSFVDHARGAIDPKLRPLTLPPLKQLERGGIVGSVEIVDCVTRSNSPWFFGRYGFVLRNPQALPFVPMKGRLGFFHADIDAPAELRRQEGV